MIFASIIYIVWSKTLNVLILSGFTKGVIMAIMHRKKNQPSNYHINNLGCINDKDCLGLLWMARVVYHIDRKILKCWFLTNYSLDFYFLILLTNFYVHVHVHMIQCTRNMQYYVKRISLYLKFKFKLILKVCLKY